MSISKFLINVSACTLCLTQVHYSYASEASGSRHADDDTHSVSESVMSTATLTGSQSGLDRNYTVPDIKELNTLAKLREAFSELNTQYAALRRAFSVTNDRVRTFVGHETAVLTRIEGVVPPEGSPSKSRRATMTATERLKTAIANLVQMYNELKTAHEALQSRSEEQTTRIAALESRVHTLEEEKVGLERAVRVLTRAEEEARAREEAARASAESHMRSPLLGEKGEKPKSDGCCSVQ
jgi:chromosome segregation ATPase